MADIVKQTQAIIWLQPNGPGTAFKPYGVGKKAGGMTGKTVPFAGRTPVYGRSEYGTPVAIATNEEAPGDLPNATIVLYEQAQVDVMLKAAQKGCPINVQNRIITCGVLNNPAIFDSVEHWGEGKVTQYSPGDGPSVEFSGETIQNEATISFLYYIRLVQTGLSALTSTATENLLDIAGIPDEDCNRCGNGYPGADQVLVVGEASDGALDANVFYSVNGGGSWAVMNPLPFAGLNLEDATFVDVRPINSTQARVIVGTGTAAAGVKSRFAYADMAYGAFGTPTWTIVSIDNTTVATSSIQAMEWLLFDRLYIAAEGDIYVSTDQGNTDPGTPIYTGATAIAGFAKSPDDAEVWAFGASNLILRELDQNGVFATRTGPSGGGAFTALTVSGEGSLFAGNGTSIFKSTDKAATAGNWDELYDFGTNKVVRAIQCIGGQRAQGGSSELLRVVVDDSAGGVGAVWYSLDGGASFQQVTALTNTGYNAAYFSTIDDNRGIVIGDAGAIHLLAPQ